MILKIPLDPPFTKGEAKNKNTFTASLAYAGNAFPRLRSKSLIPAYKCLTLVSDVENWNDEVTHSIRMNLNLDHIALPCC